MFDDTNTFTCYKQKRTTSVTGNNIFLELSHTHTQLSYRQASRTGIHLHNTGVSSSEPCAFKDDSPYYCIVKA